MTPAIGIGLRAPHMAEMLATRPAIGWLEVHAENYMGGGLASRQLAALRRDYPLSLHGVGLSLGSAEGIEMRHLGRMRALVARMEPFLVSEHLAWSSSGGAYLNDLLPLPYTEESLAIVAANVARAQDALGRRILVENPASYLRFRHSTIPEGEFLAALAHLTGCGILCDINNIHVTSSNLGGDPSAYLAALPAEAIGEIHLAGHCRVTRGGRELLIDDHGAPVAAAVWALYRHALSRFGAVPSLVEWDKALPPLATLLGEAATAGRIAKALDDTDDRAA